MDFEQQQLRKDMHLSADTTIAVIAPRDVEEKAFSIISNTMDGGAMFVHGNSVYILEEPDGDYEIVYRVVGGVVSVEARMIDGGMDD